MTRKVNKNRVGYRECPSASDRERFAAEKTLEDKIALREHRPNRKSGANLQAVGAEALLIASNPLSSGDVAACWSRLGYPRDGIKGDL